MTPAAWIASALAVALAIALALVASSSGSSPSTSRTSAVAEHVPANPNHWPGHSPFADGDQQGYNAQTCASGLTAVALSNGDMIEMAADGSEFTYSEHDADPQMPQTSITIKGTVARGASLEGIILHTTQLGTPFDDIDKPIHLGPKGYLRQVYSTGEIPNGGAPNFFYYTGVTMCFWDPTHQLP
jgi:hypothetical protein